MFHIITIASEFSIEESLKHMSEFFSNKNSKPKTMLGLKMKMHKSQEVPLKVRNA